MLKKRILTILQYFILLIPFLMNVVLTGCDQTSTPVSPSLPTLTPTPVPSPTATPTLPPPTDIPIPAPPAVTILWTPNVSDVQVGQKIAFTVKTDDQNVRFEWSAINGILSASEDTAVIYTAPETEGVDIVSLEATNAGGTTVEHISFNVVARPPDAPTPTPLPDAVVIASVNLRNGPGTIYDIISTLSLDQVLTVTGRNDNTTWLQVNVDQTQTGWVANQPNLVTLNLSPDQIPVVSPPPTPTPLSEQTPAVSPPSHPTSPPEQTPIVPPTPPSTSPSEQTPTVPPPPSPSPADFMGKVCQIKSGGDTNTIFLRQAEFNTLGLPIGTKVTITVLDIGTSVGGVTLSLDSNLNICSVRLAKSLREALGVDADTAIEPESNRPDRQFDITQTSLPTNKEVIDFQGKVCQIKSGMDTNTIFLRQPEYNTFGVPAGTTVSVTVLDTGKTVEKVTLGLDSDLATCSVRLAKSLREALGVASDTDIDSPGDRPDRHFSINLLQP